MGNPDVTLSETSKLIKDIAVLFLNEKFSDITVIVDKEKIYAHKVILAARSTYFESLLYDGGKEIEQTELQLALDISPDNFRNVLKFLYTGTISISASNIEPTLDLISLARQYLFSDLEHVIATQIKTVLNPENIFSIINAANLYDLKELQDACHFFMDENPSDMLINDNFMDLTQKSLIRLLERDTFFAPEIDIFKRVAQWCQANNDVDDLVVKCVRLSWLSVVEIVSIVWPTKLVGCEDLLQAIAEIVEVKPKSTTSRGKLLRNVNVATAEYKTTVITGQNIKNLLNGNRNTSLHALHNIGDKTGITFEFESPTYINNIHMMLWDGDLRYYQYYIQVSMDKKTWKTIIDHRKYPCRSIQNLYFETKIAKFVRIMGTHNTVHAAFHLVYFEAYFKENVPRILNGIVCPVNNVATVDKKAVVIEGINGPALLDGITTNLGSYTHNKFGSGIVVQLAQPFVVSTMKILLWNGDPRSYKYYVETSVNKTDWTIVADHRNKESKGWQLLRFPERVVVFVRLIGTSNSNSADPNFHLLDFECPANPTDIEE